MNTNMAQFTARNPQELQLAIFMKEQGIPFEVFESRFLPMYRAGQIDEKGSYIDRSLGQRALAE